jgi:hypothetical protein
MWKHTLGAVLGELRASHRVNAEAAAQYTQRGFVRLRVYSPAPLLAEPGVRPLRPVARRPRALLARPLSALLGQACLGPVR